jgi:DNA-3-methyladenine glycosylase I
MQRCEWANSNLLETLYHDNEWGLPVHDDRMLFEMLILEGAQSGLSWATILQKRDGYLQAFDDFDAKKIAQYSPKKIASLMHDKGIVRNKLKINATIENAKCFLAIQQEYGSFDKYIWSFVEGQTINNQWLSESEIPSSSPVSEAMSKALKKQGFKFVGPTTCYAYMQAIGMVNDHILSCFRYQEIKKLQQQVLCLVD